MYNDDCYKVMRQYPDQSFDLAIVDPPFGIGQNWTKDRKGKFYKHRPDYKNNAVPPPRLFKELFRVSKHQIIWGCNYFWHRLPPTNNLIFWDKGIDPEIQFGSAGYLAWTNITRLPFNRVKLLWNGSITCEPRSGIHPHEMPVKLYKWLLAKYARLGWKVFEPYAGSQSGRIAAYQMGFDYVGVELSKKYYNEGCERFKRATAQLSVF